MDINGISNRGCFMSVVESALIPICIVGDYLYWSDWQKRTIERVNIYFLPDREILMTSMEGLMDLKAFTIKGKRSRFKSIDMLDIPSIVLDGLIFYK